MSEEVSQEELHLAVDSAVEELLERAGVSGPPVDAIAIARAELGLTVRAEPGRPVRRSRRPVAGGEIVLTPELSEEQRQWAVAREIGGHCKPAILQRLGLPTGPKQGLSGESV